MPDAPLVPSMPTPAAYRDDAARIAPVTFFSQGATGPATTSFLSSLALSTIAHVANLVPRYTNCRAAMAHGGGDSNTNIKTVSALVAAGGIAPGNETQALLRSISGSTS
jgi:hypothetical protein